MTKAAKTSPDYQLNQRLEYSLPSNQEAERAILGAILLDNNAIDGVADKLEVADFYSPLHRRVYAAMLELRRELKAIHPILIGEELKKKGSLNNLGGVSTITNLAVGLPHFANLGPYIKTVRDMANLRQLIRICNATIESALAQNDDASVIFSNAQTTFNAICLQAENGTPDERFESLARVLETDASRSLEHLLEGNSSKIKTGFPGIDSSIGGGISRSDVLLLVADTGKGKSALALQLAYQIAKQNIPVAFLAGEMSNVENVLRLLSQVSEFPNLNSIESISQSEHELMEEWANNIKHVPMFFDSRTSDLQTLRPILKSMVRRHGIKVLVIDYIQLFKVDRFEKRQRTERIAEASQEVKRIAAELGIAIIEVAQFNREGGRSTKPTLHDLEGSGQLEKDASVIFILEQNEGYLKDSKGRSYTECWIRIEKGRNTGKGKIEGRFYGPSVRFTFD